MLKLYFLRHGQADWPDWQRPDDERPLTKKGKKQVKRVAKFMSEAEIAPAAILSSPLPRAYQTAAVIAEELDLEVIEEPNLGPGFDSSRLEKVLARVQDQSVMLVGHEPSMSEVIRELTGADVRFPKAGLACVEMPSREARRGQLLFLVPPNLV